MECLICGKETLNENQICDEYAQIEEIANEPEVTEVLQEVMPYINEYLGTLPY